MKTKQKTQQLLDKLYNKDYIIKAVKWFAAGWLFGEYAKMMLK
jgi:hypothetical protein